MEKLNALSACKDFREAGQQLIIPFTLQFAFLHKKIRTCTFSFAHPGRKTKKPGNFARLFSFHSR